MSNRITVEHVSTYRYANPVYSSFNEVRVAPMTTPWQTVLDSRVEVGPYTPLQSYVDYWGSVVQAFDLHQPHDELTIRSRSVVETTPQVSAPATISWEELQDPRVDDVFAELLAATPRVPIDPRLANAASELTFGLSPRDVPAAVADWVREQLRYVPGTTGVHTSALEAWAGGEGVCQDFAHLALAMVRTMGIPGRYCSGYMHPDREADIGEAVEGESHAWIEIWTGGWNAIDPTAGRPIDAHYVLVARGRDYADVCPVKGIFHGGPTSDLEVTVTITRTA